MVNETRAKEGSVSLAPVGELVERNLVLHQHRALLVADLGVNVKVNQSFRPRSAYVIRKTNTGNEIY